MFDPGRRQTWRRNGYRGNQALGRLADAVGLLNSLTEPEIQDLAVYLLGRGNSRRCHLSRVCPGSSSGARGLLLAILRDFHGNGVQDRSRPRRHEHLRSVRFDGKRLSSPAAAAGWGGSGARDRRRRGRRDPGRPRWPSLEKTAGASPPRPASLDHQGRRRHARRMEKACEAALERHAPIDILINNVGGRREHSDGTMPLDKWRS